MTRSGTTWTSRSTTVVFPVPDGAETTKSCPRRTSFDILHLLAHLLQFGLQRHDELGHARSLRFRAERVHFAVHLLKEEVELAAARLRRIRERAPMLDVGAEPDGLLCDIRPVREAD